MEYIDYEDGEYNLSSNVPGRENGDLNPTFLSHDAALINEQ